MLPNTTVLNTKTVAEILRMGYTRIPVFSGDRYYFFPTSSLIIFLMRMAVRCGPISEKRAQLL